MPLLGHARALVAPRAGRRFRSATPASQLRRVMPRRRASSSRTRASACSIWRVGGGASCVAPARGGSRSRGPRRDGVLHEDEDELNATPRPPSSTRRARGRPPSSTSHTRPRAADHHLYSSGGLWAWRTRSAKPRSTRTNGCPNSLPPSPPPALQPTNLPSPPAATVVRCRA